MSSFQDFFPTMSSKNVLEKNDPILLYTKTSTCPGWDCSVEGQSCTAGSGYCCRGGKWRTGGTCTTIDTCPGWDCYVEGQSCTAGSGYCCQSGKWQTGGTCSNGNEQTNTNTCPGWTCSVEGQYCTSGYCCRGGKWQMGQCNYVNTKNDHKPDPHLPQNSAGRLNGDMQRFFVKSNGFDGNGTRQFTVDDNQARIKKCRVGSLFAEARTNSFAECKAYATNLAAANENSKFVRYLCVNGNAYSRHSLFGQYKDGKCYVYSNTHLNYGWKVGEDDVACEQNASPQCAGQDVFADR